MYIDNIFNELKNKMIEELKDLKIEDFPKYKDLTQAHYSIIEQLIDLKKLDHISKPATPSEEAVPAYTILQTTDESIKIIEKTDVSNSDNAPEKSVEEATSQQTEQKVESDKEDNNVAEIKEPTVEETKEKPAAEESQQDDYPIGHTFTFEKKAFGGIVKGIDCLIHEDMVRELSLENGYKMKVLGHVDVIQRGRPKYEFEVVDETPFPREDLIEVKHGIVERVAGRLVVSNTASGPVKIDEMSATLFIGYKDTNRLGIRDGDIVDGRFYRNNVQSFRVSCKHEIEFEDDTVSVESRKLQHRQSNQQLTEREKGLSMIERLDKKPFRNKKIVLVGLRSRMNDFKALLDKTNEIDMIHLDGYEHKTRIRSRVLKADYVMISTVENGHKVTPYVAALCNEFDISFTSTSADGLTGILRDLKQLIDQTEAIAM